MGGVVGEYLRVHAQIPEHPPLPVRPLATVVYDVNDEAGVPHEPSLRRREMNDAPLKD